jgi:hypothetical protein
MKILTVNVLLIPTVREVSFYAGKIHNRPFRGVFRGGRDFFDPQIVLSAGQEHRTDLLSVEKPADLLIRLDSHLVKAPNSYYGGHDF